MSIQVLVGCDPEIFVKRNGAFHSAWGLIKGDKKNPFPVRNGAVQVDGMALEFNINPAKNEDEFVHNVSDVLAQLRAMVPDYELVASPCADFDIEHMKAQPAEALELGCEPDYNAWVQGTNPRPNGDRPFRTASGHVHIGWVPKEEFGMDPLHTGNAFAVTRQMDFYLGLPSLAYDSDAQAMKRRELYGRAGACRIKPYGCEYRTLSNRWLSSPKLMAWVHRNTLKGVQEIFNGNLLEDKYGDIQEIINTSNIQEAMKICKAEGIEVPNV